MLDVRTLAPGRHVLKLEDGDVPDAMAQSAADDTKADQQNAVLRIPFWR